MKIFLFLLVSIWQIGLHGASHCTSIYGEAKYSKDFKYFDYHNPHSKKGGEIKVGWLGSFNSLNPFIVKGESFAFQNLYTCATLLQEAFDEIGVSYAYLADTVEVAKDYSWVTFNLHPHATFDDGAPITADDVAFSFNILREKGHPRFSSYYAKVERVQVLDNLTIKFYCPSNKSREIGIILGQLPVLSKKFFESRDFSQTLHIPMPSSGPYTIKKFEIGQSIVFEKRKKWWGENLPSQKGCFNPQIIHVAFYKDMMPLMASLKKGEHDFHIENIAKNWATAYVNIPFLRKYTFKHHSVSPFQSFAFNLDRLSHRALRQALTLMLDFKWMNENLFYNSYRRTESIFPNSELTPEGLPSQEELFFLEPYRNQLPPEVLEQEYKLDEWSTPHDRLIMEKAIHLMKQAGFELKNNLMTDKKTGKPLIMTLLITAAALEKMCLSYASNLKKIGVQLNVRIVDLATYEELVNRRDFDMVMDLKPQTLTPGNEQRIYWASDQAGQPNTLNVAGIKNPIIDDMVERLMSMHDKEDIKALCRALGRVVMWNFYYLPLWYSDGYNIVAKDRVHWPSLTPKYQVLSWVWTSLSLIDAE